MLADWNALSTGDDAPIFRQCDENALLQDVPLYTVPVIEELQATADDGKDTLVAVSISGLSGISTNFVLGGPLVDPIEVTYTAKTADTIAPLTTTCKATIQVHGLYTKSLCIHSVIIALLLHFMCSVHFGRFHTPPIFQFQPAVSCLQFIHFRDERSPRFRGFPRLLILSI